MSFSARVHTSPPGFEPGSLGQEPRILTSKTIADSAKVAANFCTRRRIPKLARHSSLGPWCQHGQERAATVAAAPWRHSVSTVWLHLVGERRTGLKTQFGATVEGCPLRGTGEAGTAKPRGTTRGHPASDLASALPRDQHGPSIRTDPALDPAAARTRRRQHGHGISTAPAAQASRSTGDIELGGHVVLWYHARPARGKPREAPARPSRANAQASVYGFSRVCW